MCCGRWPAADRGGDRCAGVARHPAVAVARSGNAPAVPVLRRAGAGLVGEVIKWCVGRGRPFVGGEGQRVQLLALRGNRGLFQLSLRPRHHSFCAGLCRVGGVAAGAVAMIVYALVDRGQPPGAAGPSSERRGRRRAGRHHRRDVRALLVCGPPARVCDPSRRHHCAACRALVRAPQKGCPGRVRPIKADAATADRRFRPPGLSIQPDEFRFAFFRPSCGGRFHRCARAQRSRERGAADRGDQRPRSTAAGPTRSSTSMTARPTRPPSGLRR